MPSKQYALEPNHPKRLSISWKGNWNPVTISVDGVPVGVIETKKELQVGRSLSLPDGSTLEVRLQQVVFAAELHLLRNGHPIPGSDSDPQTRLAVAYGVIFFVAGLSAVIGIVTEVFQIDFLMRLGFGAVSLLGAAIYGILGFFVRRRSLVALIIAITLFGLDGIMAFIIAAEQGGNPPVGALVARILLGIPMIRGIPAIQALKRSPAVLLG